MSKLLADMLRSYKEVCTEFVGAANMSILFRAGEKVGAIYSKLSIEELNNEFGKCGMTVSCKTSEGSVTFTIENSVEVKEGVKSRVPSCFLLKGFFSAIGKRMLGTERVRVTETECKSAGSDKCVFTVTIL